MMAPSELVFRAGLHHPAKLRGFGASTTTAGLAAAMRAMFPVNTVQGSYRGTAEFGYA
jgi:hypothetical protein